MKISKLQEFIYKRKKLHHLDFLILDLPGRFKTVAELEADMATSNRNFTTPGAPIQHHVMSQPVQRKVPRSTPPAQSPKEQQDDLTAFNKLLSLMQAGAAAAVESPNKMPQIVSLPCLLLKAIVNNITILYMYVLKYLFHDLKLHQGLLHFNYYLGGLECYFIIFFTVGGESLSTELC